jgi:hypothetical protein
MCNYVGSHRYKIGTVKFNYLIAFNGTPEGRCLDTKHVAAAVSENNTECPQSWRLHVFSEYLVTAQWIGCLKAKHGFRTECMNNKLAMHCSTFGTQIKIN